MADMEQIIDEATYWASLVKTHGTKTLWQAWAQGLIKVDRKARPRVAWPRDQFDPAAIAAAANHGVISCGTALRRYGVSNATDGMMYHVAVWEGNRRVHRPLNLMVKTHRILHAHPVGNPITPAFATAQAIVCPQCEMDFKDKVALVDEVLNKGLATKAEIRKAGNVLRSKRQASLIATVLARSNGRARSKLETMTRLDLEDDGRFLVDAGVNVPDVGEVDLVVTGLRTRKRCVVELDGWKWHSGKAEFKKDRERSRALLLHHHVNTLRFTWEDAKDGGKLVSEVAALLCSDHLL